MDKTTFLIVRHGQTQWNKEGRMMGISDIPLTAEGLKQAKTVAEFLKDYPLDRIVTSPLKRAIQTAQAIHMFHVDIPLERIHDLRERSFGTLEGLTYEQANARAPQIVMGSLWQYPKFRPPDGESLADVTERAQTVFEGLIRSYNGQIIAIVSHGSFIRNFLSVILKLPLEEVNKYEFVNASISVVRYSKTSGGEAHVLNKSAE